jgi:SAM-dependent methyltransferase
VLAYYSLRVHEEFWTEHWGGHSVEELLAVARTSPLTTLITDALPRRGVVLEAGCGLGQYVILLRERGWRAAGVDGSVEALATCRRTAAVPLLAGDLRALAIRAGALAAYVSLGVVEHDPDGPDAILAEAARVLAADGTLVLSVPYLNGVRRLGAPWIRRQQLACARSGGRFYQYAFTRAELLTAVRRHGFVPLGVHPYDPARVLRIAVRALRRSRATPDRPRRDLPGDGAADAAAPGRSEPSPAVPPVDVAGGAAAATRDRSASRRRGWLRGLARQALYTPPALRMLGHMLLVVARRA